MLQIFRRLKYSPWRRIVWRRSAGARIVPFSDIRRRIFAETNIRAISTFNRNTFWLGMIFFLIISLTLSMANWPPPMGKFLDQKFYRNEYFQMGSFAPYFSGKEYTLKKLFSENERGVMSHF